MKAVHHRMRLFTVLIFIHLFSCSNQETSKEAEKVEDQPKEGASTSSQSTWKSGQVSENASMVWFVPSEIKPEDSLACILFFDPQGLGRKPLEIYKELAEKSRILLVGCKQFKNGMDFDQTKAIVKHMLREVESNSGFKHLSIYLCGFSGGAKVVMNAVSEIPKIKGVIYAGAASPLGSFPDISLFGFAGSLDMNYADLIQFDGSIPKANNHFLKIWNGKHEWPDRKAFASAIEWISINENAQSGRFEKRIQDLIFESRRTKDLLEKESLLKEAKFLAQDLNRPELVPADLETLLTRPAFVAANKLKMKEIEDELIMKEFYNPAFYEKDISWWRSEIVALKNYKRHASSKLQERILGYFSLVSYGLANRALNEQDDLLAEKILEIYKLSDPKNAEQAYLRAVLAGRRQLAELAFAALSESIGLGFSDKLRIEHQAEFQFIRQDVRFIELLSSVHQ